MPDEIYKALNRLDLQRWNPREIKESQEGIMRRDLIEITLAVEREEGEKIGEIMGEKMALERTVRAMKTEGMPVQIIARLIGLNEALIEALE